MSYNAWEAPDSYWYITTVSIGFRVDEATAQRVSDEYERGDRVLVFTDITGSQCRIAAERYVGCFESTSETRARDDAMTRHARGDEEF